ncbi:MAG: RNA polymerase sigma factor region1.1 domain-containing protein, partial [Hydrogenophaga sp.]|nr:RNA polymerase sigma factor region1.1 domain-containing protein [Hydrogenophaga sp.]
MPAKKSSTPVSSSTKPANKASTRANTPALPPKKAPAVTEKTPAKAAAKAAPAKKTTAKAAPEALDTGLLEDAPAKKKAGRPAKAVTGDDKPAAKRGRKPKVDAKGKSSGGDLDDADLSDIEDDLTGEVEVEAVDTTSTTTEKVKPLRMKISKAKERALMKEFGLDETVLSEEEARNRRERLKTLIKLGKTRGYLTHGEINDHLPDKLVEAETLEVVVSLLNDMGVAVYEQTPDAETLLLNNTGPTAATEEEAEEEAEAALSTVDSEFGRTTDPVRMYMREMGTVELLTREGEIEIAKRIEGGLNDMMEAISESPATIAEILVMAEDIRSGKVVISTVVDGFADADAADDYVAEEDFDDYDEADDDDGKGGSKALTRKLEELKREALDRFDAMRVLFEKLHKTYDKEGYGTPTY